MTEKRKFVREEVRVDDPDLSPEANRLLTAELQEALGTDRAEIPVEEAAESHRLPDGERRSLGSVLGTNRLLVAVAFIPLLVIGVMISLSTDSWWAVVAACAVHAVGTLIVASVALRVTTAVERVTPTTAARLQDEGVGDPDQALTDMLERFSPGDDRSAAEVVASGHNRVTARPGEDRGRAEAQRRTALTSASEPSEPSGVGRHADGAARRRRRGVAACRHRRRRLRRWNRMDRSGTAARRGRRMAADRAPDATGEHTDTPPQRPVLATLALVLAAVIAGVITVGAVGGYLS
jgi:hypothetical protein